MDGPVASSSPSQPLLTPSASRRYDEAWPLIQQRIHSTQAALFAKAEQMDAHAEQMLAADPSSPAAIAAITAFGVHTGEELVEEWRTFWLFLFARFRDGVTISPGPRLCKSGERVVGGACTYRQLPSIEERGYSKSWYARIARETGAHYRVPADGELNDDNGHQVWLVNTHEHTRARTYTHMHMPKHAH